MFPERSTLQERGGDNPHCWLWLLSLLAKVFPKAGWVRFELSSRTAVGSVLPTLYLEDRFHTANSLRLEFIPQLKAQREAWFQSAALDFVPTQWILTAAAVTCCTATANEDGKTKEEQRKQKKHHSLEFLHHSHDSKGSASHKKKKRNNLLTGKRGPYFIPLSLVWFPKTAVLFQNHEVSHQWGPKELCELFHPSRGTFQQILWKGECYSPKSCFCVRIWEIRVKSSNHSFRAFFWNFTVSCGNKAYGFLT